MPAWLILGIVGGLLVVAFLAHRVFRLTRIPDVMMSMALGLLPGPVLGLVKVEKLSKATNLLGPLAIIRGLFELLAVAGVVWWYGNQPVASRPAGLGKWVQTHWQRGK